MRAMSMARGDDVRTSFVNCAMDEEAGSVRWTTHVATNWNSIIVDKDHVACFEEAEVHRQGILWSVSQICLVDYH